MERKTIYFITESYNSNKVFFYNEIQSLSELYDIVFISVSGKEDVDCNIPNTTLYFYDNRVTKLQKFKFAFKYFLDKKCSYERREIFKKKDRCLFKLFRSIEYYAAAETFYKWFKVNLYDSDKKKAIYYTYWCHYYALSLALHRNECDGIEKMITRLHEFDLYDETVDAGRQPFKKLINDCEDKLIFVSQLSLEYYLDRHQISNKNKAILNRLGTVRVFKGQNREVGQVFHLVSCSTVDSRKRVDLIVQALSLLEIPIRWTHFGDGILYNDLQRQAEMLLGSKENIMYELVGRKSNNDVLRFYEENNVSVFINVSSSEGCPVSIMEAMSFGIPIIATAVGEAELMIKGNGIVLESNPEIKDIAVAIRYIYTMMKDDVEKYKIMSNTSLSRWETMFNVEENINRLKSILQEF